MAASGYIRNAMIGLLTYTAVCTFLLSQGKQPANPSKQGRPAFRVPVSVVVVNATVSDGQGKPVNNLTQGDFKVYEDGKLQTISTFALESYEPIPTGETAAPEGKSRSESVSSSPPIRPRMISILIDDVTTASSRDQYPQLVSAITQFVKQDVKEGDQVAIVSGSGRLQFPFSDNRETILEELRAISSKLRADTAVKSDCPSLTDFQAKKISERFTEDISRPSSIQDPYFEVAVQETLQCMALDPTDPNSVMIAKTSARSAASRQNQESEYRIRTLLDTFRRYIRTLKHIDAVKTAVIFSGGFLAEGDSPISYQLQDVVDQALSSGVVLNTVDIRGLYTTMPSAAERSGTAFTTQFKQTMRMEDLAAQEAPLFRIANDTGGMFYHNSNDLYDGLKQIVRRRSSYYVLTYTKPSSASDGRYHQIKVEIARPGLELSYRKGYYAPKEEMSFERRRKEDILEALQAPANLNEIPIGLAYSYYQEDDSTYVVSLSTKISIRGLPFIDDNSRHRNLINAVVVALDEMDHFVDGIEKSIDFKLTDASYATLLDHGLSSKVELKLPPGRYKIKAVVREGTQGKMGSLTKAIEIP
jgi:VWFA-related protein